MSKVFLIVLLFNAQGQHLETYSQDSFVSTEACESAWVNDVRPFLDKQIKFARMRSHDEYVESTDRVCLEVRT